MPSSPISENLINQIEIILMDLNKHCTSLAHIKPDALRLKNYKLLISLREVEIHLLKSIEVLNSIEKGPNSGK